MHKHDTVLPLLDQKVRMCKVVFQENLGHVCVCDDFHTIKEYALIACCHRRFCWRRRARLKRRGLLLHFGKASHLDRALLLAAGRQLHDLRRHDTQEEALLRTSTFGLVWVMKVHFAVARALGKRRIGAISVIAF